MKISSATECATAGRDGPPCPAVSGTSAIVDAVQTTGGDGPVTKIISRLVKPERAADYEAWIADMAVEAGKVPGYLGVSVLRPSPATRQEYVTILRFDSHANLLNWESSPQYRERLERGDPMAAGEAHVQRAKGLEFWFTPANAASIAKPPRYKMAIVIGSVIFVLSSVFNVLLIPLLGDVPQIARQLITVSLQIVLLIYLIMPFLTRVLSRWLSTP